MKENLKVLKEKAEQRYTMWHQMKMEKSKFEKEKIQLKEQEHYDSYKQELLLKKHQN